MTYNHLIGEDCFVFIPEAFDNRYKISFTRNLSKSYINSLYTMDTIVHIKDYKTIQDMVSSFAEDNYKLYKYPKMFGQMYPEFLL